MPGPVPKRSTQRRRRNTTPGLEAGEAGDGTVRGPDLKGRHCAIARRWYEALRRSGQARYYEPSDWAAAELTVHAIDQYVARPTALMFTAIQSAMTNLLTTEGDRRRARLELEAGGRGDGPTEDEAQMALVLDLRARADALTG